MCLKCQILGEREIDINANELIIYIVLRISGYHQNCIHE